MLFGCADGYVMLVILRWPYAVVKMLNSYYCPTDLMLGIFVSGAIRDWETPLWIENVGKNQEWASIQGAAR